MNTSAVAKFNITGTGTGSGYSNVRQATCSRQSDINSTTANYSCGVLIWYFDPPASTWTNNVNITDYNGNIASLNTTFTVQDTTAIVISPQSLTWPVISASAKNQSSNNDPTLINNTANHFTAAGSVRVTALNLIGVTTPTEYIPAANFSVFNNTGASLPECGVTAAQGTVLVNNTATGINNVGLDRGNNTANQGQQNLYYCIYDVPPVSLLSSQTYSTNGSGSWTIGVV